MTAERAARWARPRSRRRRRSATSAPARSSSSPTQRRPLLLHGDEHAPAGRAPGDRDDHRARPGRVAAARRRGRSPAAAQDDLRHPTAMPSRRASTRRTRTAISCRRPARLRPSRAAAPRARHVRDRRRRRGGRRDHAVLRPDDRQADRARHATATRARPAAPGARAIPRSSASRPTSPFSARLAASGRSRRAELDTGLIERDRARALPQARRDRTDVLAAAAFAELAYEERTARERAQGSGDPVLALAPRRRLAAERRFAPRLPLRGRRERAPGRGCTSAAAGCGSRCKARSMRSRESRSRAERFPSGSMSAC